MIERLESSRVIFVLVRGALVAFCTLAVIFCLVASLCLSLMLVEALGGHEFGLVADSNDHDCPSRIERTP